MAIDVGDALLTLGVDTKPLDKGMKGIGATIKKHQKAIGIGMVAAGGVILAGLGVSLKAAVDFEGAMREVNTMMGLSKEEFTEFSKEVGTLASDLGVDAVDSAKALYQAISAGVPKENVLEFLKIATEAAIGGVTNTETAVDGLTTVLNAFKLPMSDAQKVADLMFTTVKGGKTTFEELSASLFQVAPIAAASGIKFEEVAAALATMTKQGVPTKVATTQLRQAMVALQKPTKEMNEVIEDMGYESGQVMVEELGLAETLNTLRDATGGSNEMLMKMFGSVEAGQAVLALTGDNAVMFADDLKAMANAEGAATDAFNEMEEGAARQSAAIKAMGKEVMISVGNILLPILKDLLDMIKPIIENVKNWISENPKLTKVLVIGAAIFGVILTILGGLLLILPGIIATIPIMGAAFAALMGPIGLIIAGVIALIAIGILLWKNWDKVVGWITDRWQGLLEFFQNMVVSIRGIFNQIAQAMYQPIKIAIDWIINMINNMLRAINKVTSKLGRTIPLIGFKMPELPTFDQGGIAMRPMIARVAGNEPEVMIPLSKLGSIIGQGTQMMTVIMETDGRQWAKVVMPYVVGEIRLKQGLRGV